MTNKIMRIILSIALASWPLAVAAQQNVYVTNGVPQRVPRPDQLCASSMTADTFAPPPGMTQHQVSFTAPASITGLTATISASTDNVNYTTKATSTNITDTVTFTGTYSAIRVAYSSCVGAGSVTTDYYGAPSVAPSGAQDVNITKIGGTAVTAQAATSGTIAGNATSLPTVAFLYNWNGSTWVPVNTTDIVGINLTQINGATLLAGAGATGSGSPRVTLAQTGAVVPGSAQGVVVAYEALTSGGITTAMTATTSTVVGGLSGTAGKYYYITAIAVSNSHATQGTDVVIQDGSGGTAIWLCPAAPAYGGCTQSFNPPLKVPTQGNGIYAANVTSGANTKVFISAFQSAVSY